MRKGVGRSSCLIALAFLCLVPATAFAQSGIAGVVKDSSGAVMPGVTVEAASPALIERVRSVVTDGQGQYKIVDLRPGTYTVTFALAGFNTVKRESLELPASFTAAVNAEMRVGTLEETVTVSGTSPVIDVQNVSQQKVMSKEIIDAVPVARLATALTALIPGVVVTTLGDPVGRDQLTQAIHDSRPGEQITNIDGFSDRMANGVGGSTSTFYISRITSRRPSGSLR